MLFTSLARQEEGLLTECACVQGKSLQQLSSPDTWSAQKLSMDPSGSSCWHRDTEAWIRALLHTHQRTGLSQPQTPQCLQQWLWTSWSPCSQLLWLSHTQWHTYLMSASESGSQHSYSTCWLDQFDISASYQTLYTLTQCDCWHHSHVVHLTMARLQLLSRRPPNTHAHSRQPPYKAK